MGKKILTVAAFLISAVLFAQVKVADVFSDNMVLQRDAAIPVWGTADAGEKVTVSFAGQRVCVTASNTGYWMLQLSPMAASFENRTMTVSGRNNTVTINNCLVGEVWLCSGQSGNCRLRFDADTQLCR